MKVHAASLESWLTLPDQFALYFTNSIIKLDGKATANIGKAYSFSLTTPISKTDDKAVLWV
jgi:hypothetical protein